MALYPSPPGRKFEYDRDGCAMFSISEAGVITEHTTLSKERQNSEVHGHASVIGYGGTGMAYIGLIFPELRSIAGYYLNIELNWDGTAFRNHWQSSNDTTNGVDGTWTQQQAQFSNGQEWFANSGTGLPPKPSYRSNITAYTLASCKAIRFGLNSSNSRNKFFVNMHIYGDLVAGQTPDRLRLWHPTLNQELPGNYFDLQDVPRANTFIRPFRIKNNSATLTANDIIFTADALTDTTPSVISQISWDSPSAPGVYTSPSNVGTLAPDAISNIMTLRLISTPATILSLWRQRIRAAATWS